MVVRVWVALQYILRQNVSWKVRVFGFGYGQVGSHMGWLNQVCRLWKAR